MSEPTGSEPTAAGTARVKRGMAEMLKGGVIMDVVTPEQARIAEAAGAVAVMALERVPADLPGLPTALRADLDGTATRLGLARRFYNDAVRDTAALRTRRLPSLLRLHASRPLPRFFDIEDDLREVTGSAAGGGRARP